MTMDYMITKEDLLAIQEGIKIVWHPKLSFIFKDKKILQKTLVISYDSKFIYFWSNKDIPGIRRIPYDVNNFLSYQIPYSKEIPESERLGWEAGISPIIYDNLPKELKKNDSELPKISGSLMTNFIAEQKKTKGKENNPYITEESYFATIVHEFGHVYYNKNAKYWFSSKRENISYIETSLKLFRDSYVDLATIKLTIPGHISFSELFAFCTEYNAASIFWPNHKNNINKASIYILSRLLNEEKHRNFNFENSVLDENSHHFAAVFGKILITKYPTTWPQKIIKYGKSYFV